MFTTKRKTSIIVASIAVGSALSFTLAGCTSAPSMSTPTATDVWIKAVPELMDGMAMTGLFGEFCNDSSEEIYILGGVADDASLTTTKLDAHEVVKDDTGEMVMQEAGGGIPIPAKGCVTLKPGSFHVMFWDLLKPIAVGDKVKATIDFSNGSSLDVTAVAREIDNANESYHEDSESSDSMHMD